MAGSYRANYQPAYYPKHGNLPLDAYMCAEGQEAKRTCRK